MWVGVIKVILLIRIEDERETDKETKRLVFGQDSGVQEGYRIKRSWGETKKRTHRQETGSNMHASKRK
jgi:hypothetical protein